MKGRPQASRAAVTLPAAHGDDAERAARTDGLAVAFEEQRQNFTDRQRVTDRQRLEAHEREEAGLLRRAFERRRIPGDGVRTIEDHGVDAALGRGARGEQRGPDVGVIASSDIAQIDDQELELGELLRGAARDLRAIFRRG